MIEAALNALGLKERVRTGWELRGVSAPESVADHAWGTAFLCLLYAGVAGVDGNRACQMAVVHDVHKSRYQGHLGVARTIGLMRTYYHWRRMSADIAEYVVSCVWCNRTKHSERLENLTYKEKEVVGYPYRTVFYDIQGPLPKLKGKQYTRTHRCVHNVRPSESDEDKGSNRSCYEYI